MGIREKIRHLEHQAEGETVLAVCRECGAEKRIRAGIFLDMVTLDWQMHQNGTVELPADTPSDIRWVRTHPCHALALREKHSGVSVFGEVWERGVRANREARVSEG
jgi:hypothetical protein